MEYKPVRIESKDYVARNIDPSNREEMEKIYKLRHDIFVKKLAWVPGHFENFEHDEYDRHSVFFGVFKGQKLLATARFITSNYPFMLEKDFSYVIHAKSLEHKTAEAVELSRLGVDSSLVDRTERSRISMSLYRLLYEWSHKNNIRYWYLVSTELYLGAIEEKMKIHIERISDFFVSESGDRYYAAIIDLKSILKSMGIVRYVFFRWFLK